MNDKLRLYGGMLAIIATGLGTWWLGWTLTSVAYEKPAPAPVIARDIVRDTIDASVAILSIQPDGQAFIGAGVRVTAGGHILTCAHLFSDGQKFTLVKSSSGTIEAAEILSVDRVRDLALLRGSPNSHFAVVAAVNPRVGTHIWMVGSPLGYEFTVTDGVISAYHRDGPIKDSTQISAPINLGNSGGPVVTARGEIIGLADWLFLDGPVGTPEGFTSSRDSIAAFLQKFAGVMCAN